MRIIGVDALGNAVQFEADALPVEPVAAARAHGGAVAIGASSGVVTQLRLDSGGVVGKSGTATAGAAVLNKASGIILTEALATAAGVDYILTITNTSITINDIVLASIQNGSNTTGAAAIRLVAPGNGSLVIVVRNDHATAALNGTLKIAFVAFKT